MAAVGHGVVTNVLIAAVTMLGGIVTARYLGAAGRGTLAALITLPTFFSFVTTFGLPSGLVFHVRRSAEHAGGLVAAALVMSLAAGLAGAAAAFFAAPFVLKELTPELLPLARALAAFAVLGSVSNVSMAVLQAQQRFAAYNYIRIGQPAVQLVGTLSLGAGGWLTPVSAALVVLLSGLPGLIWSLGYVVAVCRRAWTDWPSRAGEIGSFGLRAYGSELLVALATHVDKLIVVGIFAPAVMGTYVVALSLSRIVTMFSSAVVTVLFPKASGRNAAEVNKLTSRAAGGTLLMAGLAAAVLIVLGPRLLEAFYGAEFRDATLAFRLLVIEAVLAGLVQVLSQAFMSLNRPGLVTLQYGSGALVAIPLLLVLAPRWGAEGAAAALLIASIVRLACTYWCFAGIMKVAAPRVLGGIGSSVATLKTAVLAVLR